MTFQQRKLILNSFVISHFTQYPIVWMLHSRQPNNHINNIHERALRNFYHDHTTSFTDLLEIDNSLTIHQRNLQKLVTGMFQLKVGVTLEIMKDIFQIEGKPYNLRNIF